MAQNRRDLIADAAIRLLARDGLRGLTHRGVDREAGLPSGSTSYYTPTRDSLIELVAHRLAGRSAGDIAVLFAELERLATADGTQAGGARFEALAQVLDGFVHRLAARSDDQRARYALMIDLIEHESIRGILTSTSPMVGPALDASRGLLARLGLDLTPEQAQNLVLLTDSLVFALVSRMGYGYVRLDTESVLRAYLTSLAEA